MCSSDLTKKSQGKFEKDYTKFLKDGALKGARIGVARDFMGADPDVDWIMESAILSMKKAGATVVDVCSGSGALGLEALSRGAAQAIFVDQAPASLSLLRENIAALGAEDRATVLSADARALPRPARACDLAFLDPPYDQGFVTPILTSLAAQGWLRVGAVVSVETGADETFDVPAGYTVRDRRDYGRAAFTYLVYA